MAPRKQPRQASIKEERKPLHTGSLADYMELTGDGDFSDLGGFTDDLDLDMDLPAVWDLDS